MRQHISIQLMLAPTQSMTFPVTPGITEYLVYRYVQQTSKGLRREFVVNVLPGSNIRTVLHHAGPGRYRIEARDRRRQVCKVYVYNVYPDGHIARSGPLKKKPKIPAPRFVG